MARAAPPTAEGPRRPAAFALLLTALAGMIDAIGLVQLNGLFVSFMSGNSTLLGMSVARGAWVPAGMALAVIAAFVAGAFLGKLAASAARPERRMGAVLAGVLGLVLLALALAWAGRDQPALVLVAVAMGWRNVLYQRVAGTEIGRSFVTGTLFGLGRALALAARGEAPLAPAGLLAAAWACFAAGAVTGGVMILRAGLLPSLAAAALVLAAITLAAAARRI